MPIETAQAEPRTVRETGRHDAAALLRELGIDGPRPVILVSGGADGFDPSTVTRMRRILLRGVVRPAATLRAVLVHGGMPAGLVETLGRAVEEAGRPTEFLGVVPADRVPVDGERAALDANHTHVVLAQGESSGDERETMFQLARALSEGAGGVIVVAGGVEASRLDVLEAVRARWPIVVLAGTGGVADRLVAATRAAADAVDADLRPIVADGELHVVDTDTSGTALGEVVIGLLGPDDALRWAWQRFRLLDSAAQQHQRAFRRLQGGILVLGLVATLLALLKTQLESAGLIEPGRTAHIVWFVVLAVPIVGSIVIGVTNRFKPGTKWVLLRAAAEAVKSEIFRYRARAGDYRRPRQRTATLGERVGGILSRLKSTEVTSGLVVDDSASLPAEWLTPLDTEQYLVARIKDQLEYYDARTRALHSEQVRGQAYIVIVGGVATLLAAIDGFAMWVALMSATAAAIATHLTTWQVEPTIATYNQAAFELRNLEGWWRSRSLEDRRDPANTDRLIEAVEKVLAGETEGWGLKMQDALAALRKEQDDSTKK